MKRPTMPTGAERLRWADARGALGQVASRRLLPEEDAIGEPDDDEDQDDTLPADLWYRQQARV